MMTMTGTAGNSQLVELRARIISGLVNGSTRFEVHGKAVKVH